jgi:MFS superfamily sulfate permease-like transporter
VKVAGLDLGTTLLFTGVYNIITGFVFDLPMPVQPMKTIAAVALAEPGALTIPQIMAAGIFVSACILFLGATGLMGLVTRLIPAPVIRGMQLGLGLQLALKGWQSVWYSNGKGPPTRQAGTTEGLVLGLAALVFVFLTIYPRKTTTESGVSDLTKEEEETSSSNKGEIEIVEDIEQQQFEISAPSSIEVLEENNNNQTKSQKIIIDRRTSFWQKVLRPIWALGDAATAAVEPPTKSFTKSSTISTTPPQQTSIDACCSNSISTPLIPAALILVVLGVILTIASSPEVLSSLSMGPSTPQIIVPSASDWKTGILRAGLPQLPLTAFNSVLSVCQLAEQMFPSRPARPSSVAASVGAMNLVGCWFGAMPSCHGAGGLAGQVRFGARWGTAPVFLGLIKVTLSLLFGSSLFALLQQFPSPLLGAMLVFSGMELAAVAFGGQKGGERSVAVMLFTAAVVLGMNNVAVGVVSGLLAAYLLAARDYLIDGVLVLKNKYRLYCNRNRSG